MTTHRRKREKNSRTQTAEIQTEKERERERRSLDHDVRALVRESSRDDNSCRTLRVTKTAAIILDFVRRERRRGEALFMRGVENVRRGGSGRSCGASHSHHRSLFVCVCARKKCEVRVSFWFFARFCAQRLMTTTNDHQKVKKDEI